MPAYVIDYMKVGMEVCTVPESVIPEISLNAQDFSSVRLAFCRRHRP
jgi:hypothetical protein